MKEGFTDIYVIITVQKKMGRRVNLQTRGAQRIHTFFEIAIKLTFIKMSESETHTSKQLQISRDIYIINRFCKEFLNEFTVLDCCIFLSCLFHSNIVYGMK